MECFLNSTYDMSPCKNSDTGDWHFLKSICDIGAPHQGVDGEGLGLGKGRGAGCPWGFKIPRYLRVYLGVWGLRGGSQLDTH